MEVDLRVKSFFEAPVEAHCMEVSLLVKSFFEAPMEAVLQRMAGAGGRRLSVAEARGIA